MQSPSEEPYVDVDSFFLPKGILDPDEEDDRFLPEPDELAGDRLLNSSDFVPHLTASWSSRQQEFARHTLGESVKSSSLLENHGDSSALSPIVFKSIATDCCPATPPPPSHAAVSSTTSMFLGEPDGHHVERGDDTSSPRALYVVPPPLSRSSPRIELPALVSSPSLPPGLNLSVRLPRSEEQSTPHRRVREGAFRKQVSSPPRKTTTTSISLTLEQVEAAETKKSYASVVAHAKTNTNTTTPVRNKPGGTAKHLTGKPAPLATSSVPSPRSSWSSSVSSRGVAAGKGDNHQRKSSSNLSESNQSQSLGSAEAVVEDGSGISGTDSNKKWKNEETNSPRSLSDPEELHGWSPETTTETTRNDASNLEHERCQASPVPPDRDDLTTDIPRDADRVSQIALDGTCSAPKLTHAEVNVAVESCESGNALIDWKELSSILSPATLMFYIRSAFATLVRTTDRIVRIFDRIFQLALVVYNLVVSMTGKCIALMVNLFVTAAKLIILIALATASISRFAVAEIGQGSGSSYAVFYILPLLCDALMLHFSLPHYTPHFISTLALCHVCQPQSTKRRLVGGNTPASDDDQVSEEFSRTVLRGARYALLALELWEGFSESNMCYMRADVETRLLLAYVLALARLNLLLSPVAWVCWASQYLSTCLVPGNVVTQVLLILIGLASIRLSSQVQSENRG